MPINNITQTISTIPEAGHRGVDVQTQFVIKQEDFQDHLQGTTVTELNTFKDQLNTRIGEINSTATTMNGYANTASAGASTATTKAGEAEASASAALTSRNQAETFKNNASASASTATTKASEASASALSASTSASTATTKASEASASASQALTSRNQAETFAQQAEASALSVDVNNLQTTLNAKANLASPELSGTPTAPTAAAGTNTTQLATTAFVLANSIRVSNYIASKATSGYVKLPNGIYIQWGQATAGTTTAFPIAFPNACFRISSSISTSSASGIAWSQLSITASSTGVTMNSGGVNASYIAIGH